MTPEALKRLPFNHETATRAQTTSYLLPFAYNNICISIASDMAPNSREVGPDTYAPLVPRSVVLGAGGEVPLDVAGGGLYTPGYRPGPGGE